MPGLLRGIARTAVIAGTATAVSNGVSRRQASRWAEQEQQQQQYAAAPPQAYAQPRYQEQTSAPPAAAAPGDTMSDKLEQLRQLGELKSQGVLTEEEFALQKQRILA